MLRALLLTLVGTCSLSIAAWAADVPAIAQDALQKRIDAQDSSLIVLDVRTPAEFAAGHVPGAINIPYTYLPASISQLKDASDKDIVLYCETGVRAGRAATRLQQNGFTRLLHLDGDMKRWRENERPVGK